MQFRTDIPVLSAPVLLFLAFAAEVDCAAEETGDESALETVDEDAARLLDLR